MAGPSQKEEMNNKATHLNFKVILFIPSIHKFLSTVKKHIPKFYFFLNEKGTQHSCAIILLPH